MAKVLFIEASPRKESSYSSQVANEFLDSYRAVNPDDEIEHLPLFETDLAPLGMQGANQKMENLMKLMTTGSGIEAQGEWAGVMHEIERLKSADKVVLSTAMWNFSIPYRLKHWIDLVTQVGVTVMVNNKFEYVGQITDRPLQVIMASGSPYEDRFPLASDAPKTDFASTYIDHIFRFLGFTDINLIRVQPTGMPGPALDEALAKAKEAAREAAKEF